MLWPENATKAIANAFYDKQFALSTDTIRKDEEGGAVRVCGPESLHNGNVRFNDLGVMQTELGLNESIDIAVTCDTSVKARLNDTLTYAERKYVVTNVIPSDSHLTITGKLWVSQ